MFSMLECGTMDYYIAIIKHASTSILTVFFIDWILAKGLFVVDFCTCCVPLSGVRRRQLGQYNALRYRSSCTISIF